MTRRSRPGEPLLIALAALFFLALGIVWCVTAAMAWRACQAERLLARGLPVSQNLLQSALEQAENLEKAFLPGRHVHATALMATALHGLRSEEAMAEMDQDDALLRSAHAATKTALTREPANSAAWARLAYLMHRLDGPSPETAASLRMSFYTGPAKSSLLSWRLGLAARNHAFWDDQMADLIRGQILLAWQDNPELLVQTAASHGLLPIIQVVLAVDRNQLETLEALIERHERR